jgi:hypothetical protein
MPPPPPLQAPACRVGRRGYDDKREGRQQREGGETMMGRRGGQREGGETTTRGRGDNNEREGRRGQ